ncbi:MAG: 50S ribosomal protein L27 [Candidatus Woykebacteria bacterium RIFCSPHIGHO2_12_FULL_45_10]|uniref:Large ribosomal subunit protein bL27 n=1 Tax=Candidatus Woykebacteria bacterium RIFCSPHIGHO2_12_FULL_45_10 TaxID=1802603 RepID=A0A1G1WRX8_9BACT|nr:MAG: 50S ribosomal protein L27 [Candidatus Woykebacteria bacterium RIFCSPHIGHO2_12_FULL_45_10]
MAHKKAGGSKATQKGNVAGKRLGFKVYAGSAVKAGHIVLRQRGTKFHAGSGTGLGRDHSVFATADGTVAIKVKQGRKFVEISK